MVKNYLKIAFRNILKHKVFSAINIAGMTIGMTSFFLISLFVWDELSFDNYYPEANNTFRIYNIRTGDDGNVNYCPIVPPTFGPTMEADFPEIESTTRILNILGDQLFEIDSKRFMQNKGVYAEPTIFDMLAIEIVQGSPEKTFNSPNQLVLSETLAEKLFNNENPLGKSIKISGTEREVIGVYKNLPEHSHLDLEYIMSFATVGYYTPKERMESWNWQQFYTYIKLENGADPQKLQSKFPAFVEKYAYPYTKPSGYTYLPYLQNIKDIHLFSSNFEWEIAKTGNYQTVYALSAVAIFILVIVCINFINLSTARALKRNKEVGVRKISGAFRKHIVFQFLGESIILAFFAMIVAGLLTEILLPKLNDLTGKSIVINFLSNYPILFTMIGFAILLGIVAGAYPAFFTSSFMPIDLLRSRTTAQAGNPKLRVMMVLIQLSISVFLMIGSIVVYQQLSYLQNKNLGFSIDQKIVLNLHDGLVKNLETTKSEFLSIPGVESAAYSYGVPGGIVAGDLVIDPINDKTWPANMFMIDGDYLNTMDMEIVAGRGIVSGSQADENFGFIINETGAKNLGFDTPEDAIGKPLHWNQWTREPSIKKGNIIGVVKDFHFKSLREELSTTVLHVFPNAFRTLTLKLNPANLDKTIAKIEGKWNLLEAEWPFSYKFLDSNFDKMYRTESALRTLFLAFTVIAILISSMGLFGLIYYSAIQKRREIGIRKTLGANVTSIVYLMIRKFLNLTFLSLLLTIPFSYYVATIWLENYSYQIELKPSIFLYTAGVIITLVLVTLSFQTIKSALANPVDSLKEE